MSFGKNKIMKNSLEKLSLNHNLCVMLCFIRPNEKYSVRTDGGHYLSAAFHIVEEKKVTVTKGNLK